MSRFRWGNANPRNTVGVLAASAWEQRQLGELGQFYSGIFGKSKADFGHGEARYVTFLNVLNNPIADPSLVAPIEVDARQNVVSEGDILFTMSSETPADVGLSSLWPGSDRTVYLNSFCFGLRPRVSGLGSYYAAAFRAPHFRKDVSLLAQGISRFNISRRRVSELRTAIPSHQEASRIGALFSQLDSLITLHQRQLEQLRNLKRALLEKMFV